MGNVDLPRLGAVADRLSLRACDLCSCSDCRQAVIVSWLSFTTQQRDTFFPAVSVTFSLPDGEHAHVALLLSPFAYTTYRGS